MSDRVIRPGPLSLEPGLCPGGVIVRVYATTDPPTLVVEQRLGPNDNIEDAAEVAAALSDEAGGWAACLVAYDGDTGERMAWST